MPKKVVGCELHSNLKMKEQESSNTEKWSKKQWFAVKCTAIQQQNKIEEWSSKSERSIDMWTRDFEVQTRGCETELLEYNGVVGKWLGLARKMVGWRVWLSGIWISEDKWRHTILVEGEGIYTLKHFWHRWYHDIGLKNRLEITEKEGKPGIVQPQLRHCWKTWCEAERVAGRAAQHAAICCY